MLLNELVPWRKDRRSIAVRGDEQNQPFYALERQMNRLFDDFFGDFALSPWKGWSRFEAEFVPRIDVADTDKEVTITAELPGMNEKDIEVSLHDGLLTLQGEKKQSTEEKKDGYTHSECSYGSFSRSIALPAEVDESKIDASYKNGVLKIHLPKKEAEQTKAKKVEIKAG